MHKKNKIKVGIKLCGHCSPRRDMMELVFELENNAKNKTFVFFSMEPECDVLLILNACHVACAAKPVFQGPVVAVTPDTVNYWHVEEEYLAREILKLIDDIELT